MVLYIKTVAFIDLKGRKQYPCGLLKDRQLGVKVIQLTMYLNSLGIEWEKSVLLEGFLTLHLCTTIRRRWELSVIQMYLSIKLSPFLPTFPSLSFLWESLLAHLLIELFLEYNKEVLLLEIIGHYFPLCFFPFSNFSASEIMHNIYWIRSMNTVLHLKQCSCEIDM